MGPKGNLRNNVWGTELPRALSTTSIRHLALDQAVPYLLSEHLSPSPDGSQENV